MSKSSTQFKKGSIPWNKGKEYLRGEKHPMYGKKHTEESKLKMSESLKGKIPWNKGKKGVQIAWNKGIQRTWESPMQFKKGHIPTFWSRENFIPWNKGKIGLSTGFPKGKKNKKISGEHHYCWKGGVTLPNHKIRTSAESKNWRESVFKRDNFQCQFPSCDSNNNYFHSHHIKTFSDFPEGRTDEHNGITLCKDCHKRVTRKEKLYENLFNIIVNSNLKYNLI